MTSSDQHQKILPPPPPPRRRLHSVHGPKSLMTQLLEAKLKLDEAKEAYDKLVDQARAEMPYGHWTDGRADVLVAPNRTWNKEKALENYGEVICTMQVDLKRAKAVMTGVEFESFYVEGPRKITVKEKE
jgi:hypothetical protein